ncbi:MULTISPECIES: NfeD family protein [unclassified Leptolyngbya]|uniref:NfeD family protein n=1 Tax=unclassified Leptolyngbya TaxID=2650499 RepID=UPI001681E438|nr:MULTISPECIES: NfeD family protein [unclassified Leptolyngbya]MBD1913135.1 NfeD family protein [Leptolyngbya sp. FACHB-8]MBD2157831.1 NfeD family protein [Leptolyngbya sp. FACHB-16]
MSSTTIWLLTGLALCMFEAVLPTAFVTLTLGISAILVGLLALVIPNTGIQIALWMVFSFVLVIASRRFLPVKPSNVLEDSREATTLTEILPGKTGRVLYEGNSWQALLDADRAIAPNQPVVVVGRRGTTLLIVPLHELDQH